MKGQTRGHRIVGPITQPRLERHFFGTATALITTAISIAMSIAAAAVQYVQQQKAAETNARNQKAMMDAQDEAIRQNAALANRQFMEQSKALQERQAEADQAAVAKEIDVSKQGAAARSTAATAAGEAGVAGLSVQALYDDYSGQEANYRFQSRTELENTRSQTERELLGARDTAEGRINSMKPYQAKPVDYPSLLGAALRVGGDAAGTIAKRYTPTPQTPSVPKASGPDSSTWGDYL